MPNMIWCQNMDKDLGKAYVPNGLPFCVPPLSVGKDREFPTYILGFLQNPPPPLHLVKEGGVVSVEIFFGGGGMTHSGRLPW